jgi:hypothetical protein
MRHAPCATRHARPPGPQGDGLYWADGGGHGSDLHYDDVALEAVQPLDTTTSDAGR